MTTLTRVAGCTLARSAKLTLCLGPLLFGCQGAPSARGLIIVSEDSTDLPLRAASPELRTHFSDGDATFDTTYLPGDGLGPDYIRSACSSCHASAAKGPGSVQKMAIVEADGVTPAADQSALPYGPTVRPYVADGAETPILPPTDNPALKLSLRIGLAVFGRGYMEAVQDSEIERMETEQAARTDGIHGRINRVTFNSEANPDPRFPPHQKGETGLIGRFGLKARIATLDDFAADAAQGDMSMTSPMRPSELPNPDGKVDDEKTGVDIGIDVINLLADYMRLLDVPPRKPPSERGQVLFTEALCSVCHVPSLKTRADYPFAALASIDAPIYTDLLLHDMGDELADGLTDGSATSREWRTAPLMGLHHFRVFLHDGRATTIEEAILAHGGTGSQAKGAVEKFQALSSADQQTLLDYVSSL